MMWFTFITGFFVSEDRTLDLTLAHGEILESQIDRDEIDRIIFS